MEVTKWLKPSISVSRIGGSASVQAATRVNAEQALYGAFFVKKFQQEVSADEQGNFDSYTPMRMSQIPEIDVSIIGNGEPAVGCGEPAVTVIAPAIGNAIFNAVGARVRSLPITAEAVKAGLSFFLRQFLCSI